MFILLVIGFIAGCGTHPPYDGYHHIYYGDEPQIWSGYSLVGDDDEGFHGVFYQSPVFQYRD